MNVWQPEINKRGAFIEISAGFREVSKCVSDSLFQVFDVYVCMICMQAWLCVCERESVDSKFKNIGTNEYFLSCGFSSLFCFIYCLNCNNYNKEKDFFRRCNQLKAFILKHETCQTLLYQAELDGCFRNTQKLPVVYFCCCVPL